jgi:peroxiredoxin
MSVIAPGTPAPDFTLKRANFTTFTREDLLGKTTVLVFYPFAFSPVCTNQMQVYEEALEDLAAQGVAVYGVSTDPVWSQTAFKEKLGITIEQLSDFEPKGATAKKFGAYVESGGMTDRALVIVGPDGIVRWSHLIFDGLAAVSVA